MADYFHDPDLADTEATVTASVAGETIELVSIEWSYGGTPAGGAVIIESPVGQRIWRAFITSGGPGQFRFDSPKKGAGGQPMKVRLLAGGANVKGTLGFTTH